METVEAPQANTPTVTGAASFLRRALATEVIQRAFSTDEDIETGQPLLFAQMTPLASAKTLVVKVGSSLVTAAGRGLDSTAIARWADEIARLVRERRRVVLVSSGAIAEGVLRLGWSREAHRYQDVRFYWRA